VLGRSVSLWEDRVLRLVVSHPNRKLRGLRGLKFVVSHPFRDEAAKWMGHGRVWIDSEVLHPLVPVTALCGLVRWGLEFVVSHPFRDEAAERMGHGCVCTVRGTKVPSLLYA